MYKNLFRIAFLFVAGVCITACSSGDDDIADNTTPGTPGSKENVVILTGTIGTGSEMTRALGTDGKTVSWKVNDAIAVHYQKTDDSWATVEGKITKVDGDDSKLAEFTAKLTDPKTTSGIGLAYPYEHVSSDTFDDLGVAALDFDYSCLETQGGTTTTITNSKQDLAKTEDTEIAISISGGAATLNKTAILKNQVCICKFNLKMGEKRTSATNYANYYASSITVTDKSYTPNVVYTVENRDVVSSNLIKTNTFYVAMRKTNTTTAAISIRTTTGSGLTSGADLNPSAVSVGQIIGVDHADGNKAKTYTLTNNATVTINYSSVNLVNGKFYEKDVRIGENITPIAVVAYAGASVSGYCEKFIALALEDVSVGYVQNSESQSLVSTWLKNHSIEIGVNTYNSLNSHVGQYGYDEIVDDATTALNSSLSNTEVKGWRLPTIADWRLTFRYLCGKSDSRIDLGASVLDFTPFLNEADKNLISLINNACGNNEIPNVGTATYWTGSHFTNEQGNKVWRANLYNAFFDWLTPENNAHIRMLLAY